MVDPSSPPAPSGHSPPTTPDAVNLTTSLCLTYTLCIAALRVWIRKTAYGIDDYLVLVTTLITLGFFGATYVALGRGLGESWERLAESGTGAVSALDEAMFAGIVTWIVAVYLSKCVVVVFLIRLAKTPWTLKLYYILLFCMASLGVVSVLLATVDCQHDSGYVWAFGWNEQCPTQSLRWKTITGLDAATEILLLVLPVQLIWGLQMPKSRKAIIITAFYIRLPVLPLTLGRDHYTLLLARPTNDPGTTSALVTIWMQIQLAYSLAASTLSALKAFAESFDSGFGLGIFARNRRDDEYVLSEVSKGTVTEKPAAQPDIGRGTEIEAGPHNNVVERSSPQSLKLRPEGQGKTITRVEATPMDPMDVSNLWREQEGSLRSQGSSSGGAGSDDMVILRRTDYSVQNDRAPILER